MDFDPISLFVSIIWSFVAMGYIAYGKKHNFYFQLAGIVLLIFLFIPLNIWWMVGGGAIISALPFLLERL